MVVIGVVGVLVLPLVLMESVCGKILEGGGTLYLGFFSLKLEMVQKCGFGQIVGVVLLLFLIATLICLGFVVIKRQVWRIL